MAHDAIDPFWVDHARAHHLGDFFFQRFDHRAFRARMIIVIVGGRFTLQMLGCGAQAAFKLVIIIAIQ